MDLTTGDTVQLTFGSYRDIRPSWSPDRSRIAFVSDREGGSDFDLFTINVDGSGLRQLTDTPENETQPVWSPEGTRIAYVVEEFFPDRGSERRLYLISANGSNVQKLTEGPGNDSRPDWSSDGRFLVFEREEPEGSTSIYLWDSKTGSFTRLDLPGQESRAVDFFYPRWLPYGGYLLSMTHQEFGGDVIDVSEIVVFQVQERDGEIELRQTPAAIETNFANYVWGPSGEWLIAPVQPNHKVYGAYDLLRLRVSLMQPSKACWECFLVEPEFLTDDDFYDDYPDWAP